MQSDEALGVRAFAFAAEVRDGRVMSELAAAVHASIAPLGMTAAACGMVSGLRAASANVFHFASWPEEWMAHYVAEDFLLVDPTVRWARNSGEPIAWSDLIARLPARDPGRRTVEAAARFSFTEGMAIPTRSMNNALGLVCFGGPRGPLAASEQTFLTVIARLAFEAAERIEHGNAAGRAAPVLSSREIECLTLLVRGHSDLQIGQLLGLAERTVRFHLDNARTKSGAISRTHLAALAIAHGFVTI